jgi:acyl-CoA-binding protein
MNEQDLDIRVSGSSKNSFMTQASLPQDVQLRLYAYYKHATFGIGISTNFDLSFKGCFKMNALMQISSLCASEAKNTI